MTDKRTALQDLWQFEREFWLADAAKIRQRLAEPALLVFPPPTGVLQGMAGVEALAAAPRWTSVVLRKQTLNFPAAGVAVLAYAVRAGRDDSPDHQALCSSTYVHDGEAWKLALHHQTALTE
ncbi:hypothetical protein [Piscinibacter sakaiensis]|uniref:hypothetical protein n=1 Tax=Piscinibacter sakaiensis TaxID=1547922 RepID=UPI003AAD392D